VPERSLDRFEQRTFHHRDFDVDDLAARKRAEGRVVSVVVPARDEEPTVGDVVGVVRSRLQERIGLVDEVLVVDADSTDRTGEVAAAAGARVVRQSQVLPEAGTAPGKGEALWKGLAAARGDLLVFIDADLHDLDPRFVVGLLGPLLTDPAVGFTKATYDRPLRVDDALQPAGGGRVTELLARPLLATFWPELAWLAQPLSGEYAGRRELLETLPFVRGYGVELAMLIDLAEGVGVDAIAQVDLGRRVHEHQPLSALSRMASELLHVALSRLERAGRASFREPFAAQLLQPERDLHGRLVLAPHRIEHAERPPLARWREEHGTAP
jgi:glucosyl-3-phosphoglycerate synthase